MTQEPTSPQGIARIGAIILAAECLALLVLAGVQVVDLAIGDVRDVVSGIALIVLTVVAAAAVGAFAAATWRGASWGRSGGIVTQLMILAIAVGAVSGAYAQPLTGILLAVPAIAGFVVLVLAVRQAGTSRRP
ncbi:MAG TPA: histidine kinase [Microbacterium sp.]|uniref:histidine kinase n=1 Tax=Microbacterium sp. TaxID=51671 RepID=UPI002B46DE0C|nr:histidine kinase [Microbacterium sp.]HKT57571.1 histidine kinase [Microbacterium sp.]